MSRDFQQRWAHAYYRAKARRRRRTDTLIAVVKGNPAATSVLHSPIRRADDLLGEAVQFEARVNDMLTDPRYWAPRVPVEIPEEACE